MNSARLMPATSAPTDCEISPCEYQSRAAATRISFTNSVGDKRSAESAPSGTSTVTLDIARAVPNQDTAALLARGPVGLYAQRGAEAPREVLPIVSRLSADHRKFGCGG